MVNGDGDGEAIHSLYLFFKHIQIYVPTYLAPYSKHYKMHKIALTKSIKLIAGTVVSSLYQIAISSFRYSFEDLQTMPLIISL